MTSFLASITKKNIILPFYHAVAEQPLPHIKHLYRMKTVKEFGKDLDFLLKHFEPIDAETLHRFQSEKTSPKKPVFHLTFDDGLKEAYEIIAPILLEKGIPATFFINSEFADNKALFYRNHASLSIENLLQQGKLTHLLKTEILSCKYAEKDKLFQYFSQSQVDDFLNWEKPFMTSEQIKSLHEKGFSIGAHSIDHPYFFEISPDEQLRQTLESLDFVTSVVHQKLKMFAFPFTDFEVSKTFFEAIKPHIHLSFGTAGLKDDEISFNLQRIAGEQENFKSLSAILKTEYLKYIAKFLLRKNKIHRN
ncbi:MAG: polysaccharide deacetylase family protein [Flavobacteriaceae bacterium]|jgi:peptidoglycan/xylan/chitin deacetylase (PgdA/CDA1 family)|nr:polysaccharide deacetylase family protein [Flavobacteriaceae bacterium]